MTKIIPSQIHFNSFNKNTFDKIKALLESIPSDYYQRKQIASIKDNIVFNTNLTKEKMVWIIGQDPAYFVQSKKDSAAIFRIEGTTIIVYEPKYLEYPQIAHIPIFKQVPEKTQFSVTKVEVGKCITPVMEKNISKYILDYYSSLHKTDNSEYQQKFITDLKHKLSKETSTLYWHLVLDTKNTQISYLQEMDHHFIYRIQGTKTDKYLYAYSQKGVNNPILKIAQSKWKQILTFILLFTLLMTVAMCPDDGQDKPSYCANKSTIFYAIGGFFMIMVGMKIADRKKRKLPGASKAQKEPKQEGQPIKLQ